MMWMPRDLWLVWFLSIFGIAWLDYATGKELMVWSLYLLPVGVASWMQGVRAGVVLSLLACTLIFSVGLLDGHSFSSLAYFLVAIANRLQAMLMVSWLASRLCRKQMLEQTLQSYEETMDYYHLSPQASSENKSADGAEQVAGTPGRYKRQQ